MRAREHLDLPAAKEQIAPPGLLIQRLGMSMSHSHQDKEVQSPNTWQTTFGILSDTFLC